MSVWMKIVMIIGTLLKKDPSLGSQKTVKMQRFVKTIKNKEGFKGNNYKKYYKNRWYLIIKTWKSVKYDRKKWRFYIIRYSVLGFKGLV